MGTQAITAVRAAAPGGCGLHHEALFTTAPAHHHADGQRTGD